MTFKEWANHEAGRLRSFRWRYELQLNEIESALKMAYNLGYAAAKPSPVAITIGQLTQAVLRGMESFTGKAASDREYAEAIAVAVMKKIEYHSARASTSPPPAEEKD